MKTSDTFNPIACSEAELLLENRISQEVLSKDDALALERHLDHCQTCQNFVKWVSDLPNVAGELSEELSDNEIETARLKMHEARRRLQKEGKQKTIIRVVVAVAAVAAITVGGGWMQSTFQSIFAKDTGDMTGKSACTPADLTELAPGILMTHCQGPVPAVKIEDDGGVRVLLSIGIVGLRIDPKRPNKHDVFVETPRGRVVVKGTIFAVQSDQTKVRVAVLGGVVEFIPHGGADSMRILAGETADLRLRTLIDPSELEIDSIWRALNATTPLKESAIQTPATGKNPVKSGLGEHTNASNASLLASSGNTELRQKKNIHTDAVSGTGRSNTHSMPPLTKASSSAVPTIDTLIQNAQSCLIARDWKCASSRYHDVLQHYPHRPESTAILVSLAKIELRHLAVPQKAFEHYKSYQQQAPDGPLAEEALWGIAQASRKLGKGATEKKTLQLFILRYPQSAQLKRARNRLQQLGANTN